MFHQITTSWCTSWWDHFLGSYFPTFSDQLTYLTLCKEIIPKGHRLIFRSESEKIVSTVLTLLFGIHPAHPARWDKHTFWCWLCGLYQTIRWRASTYSEWIQPLSLKLLVKGTKDKCTVALTIQHLFHSTFMSREHTDKYSDIIHIIYSIYFLFHLDSPCV